MSNNNDDACLSKHYQLRSAFENTERRPQTSKSQEKKKSRTQEETSNHVVTKLTHRQDAILLEYTW